MPRGRACRMTLLEVGGSAGQSPGLLVLSSTPDFLLSETPDPG